VPYTVAVYASWGICSITQKKKSVVGCSIPNRPSVLGPKRDGPAGRHPFRRSLAGTLSAKSNTSCFSLPTSPQLPYEPARLNSCVPAS
jgi:hypothetical protein